MPVVPDAHQAVRFWSPLRALTIGTCAVGALDALDAIVVFGLRSGATPTQIFQTIASGLIGSAAYQGGLATAGLGLVLHFFIALGIVAAYLGASRLLQVLARRPYLFGALYGFVVFFAMNLVVLPLSAIGGSRLTTFAVTNGLLIHVLGVGIPAALAVSKVRLPPGA